MRSSAAVDERRFLDVRGDVERELDVAADGDQQAREPGG
jgi:hypothetical protein